MMIRTCTEVAGQTGIARRVPTPSRPEPGEIAEYVGSDAAAAIQINEILAGK